MSTKWRTVKIPSVIAKQVDELLETAGYKSRSEWVTDAIRRRLEELEQTIKKSQHLTKEEQLQLTEAANEISRSLGCLEEESVREYLEDHYHWWPKAKIARGVQFICSLKIKN